MLSLGVAVMYYGVYAYFIAGSEVKLNSSFFPFTWLHLASFILHNESCKTNSANWNGSRRFIKLCILLSCDASWCLWMLVDALALYICEVRSRTFTQLSQNLTSCDAFRDYVRLSISQQCDYKEFPFNMCRNFRGLGKW